MKLHRKATRHSHRGVIGVESAIVMIAFVIVAAALAFVVLNMGFTTSQKAKTTVISSLGEGSSSMQVAGKVTGGGCTLAAGGCDTTPYLNATAIPIKITSGGDEVSLSAATTAVKYLSNSVEYDDIYDGPIYTAEHKSVSAAFTQATSESGTSFSDFDLAHPVTGNSPVSTSAFIYWPQQSSANDILDEGEHAVLIVAYSASDRPTALDTIKVELIVATGASLTVERQIPVITNTVVDLG